MYGLLGALLGLHGRLGKGPMLLYILVVTGGVGRLPPLSPLLFRFPPSRPLPLATHLGGRGVRSVGARKPNAFVLAPLVLARSVER